VNILKKVLALIIIISFIAAGWGLTVRVSEIDSSNQVEIVIDGEAYQQLKSLEPQLELSDLKKIGLSGAAVYQKNIEDFLEEGSLKRLEGIDLALAGEDLRRELEEENVETNRLAGEALFAVLSDSLIEQLDNLAPVLNAEYAARTFRAGDFYFIYFQNWHDSLEDLNIGYDAEFAAEAESAGLDIIYRSGNDLNSLSVLENNLALLTPDMLIFDGEEITGFPAELEKTAEIIRENKLLFGYIEAFIADQSGAKKLADLIDLNILRTHSMQQEEVEKASPQLIVDRYLRAVRERSVRVIYHKPYLEGNDLLQRNLALLDSLKDNLNAENFVIGDAEALPYFSGSLFSLLAALLGVTAAGILLLNYFSAFNYAKLMNIFFVFSAGTAFLLLQSGRIILLRQITAFGAAVIIPSLAVIAFILDKKSGGEEIKEEAGVLKASLYLTANFSAAVFTAFMGGIFVSASLNTSDFIFKLEQFRGVKAAFLLPLILISIYYLLQLGGDKLKNSIPEFLETAVKVKHIILAGGLAFIAVVYIGRTGNFPLLPVPNWEMLVRSLLEKILYVRPRFKEFLIGHPLFMLTLWLAVIKRKKLYFYPLLMLASVGVITAVNTFSHLHTPLLISILRTFHSYWLGLILGAVFILGYELLEYLYRKYYLA
jgi:hypothetical protein